MCFSVYNDPKLYLYYSAFQMNPLPWLCAHCMMKRCWMQYMYIRTSEGKRCITWRDMEEKQTTTFDVRILNSSSLG